MKRNRRTISWLFLIGMVLLSLIPVKALAEEGNVGFSVSPHLQEDQRKTGNSFFDLLVEPNQKVTLSYDITNSSEKEQTFDIAVNPAYTNDEGQIDYVDQAHKRDGSLAVDLSKIASYEKKTSVPAGETKTMTIQLAVPEQRFSGEVLGGIHVARKTAEGEQEGAQLVNQFAYVMGLRMVESDASIKRDLKLIDVVPGLSHRHTAIKVKMQNPQPTEMGKLDFTTKIKAKGSDKVLRTTESKGLSMAPNSSFDYTVDWKDKALEAGDYTLAMTVKDAKGNTWTFDKGFTIAEKEAKEYNASAVDVTENQTNPWLYALLGLIAALIIGLILFLILKRRKKEDE